MATARSPAHAGHQPTRGRPRTRGPVKRLTLEIDQWIFDQLARYASHFGISYRETVELALTVWLKEE